MHPLGRWVPNWPRPNVSRVPRTSNGGHKTRRHVVSRNILGRGRGRRRERTIRERCHITLQHFKTFGVRRVSRGPTFFLSLHRELGQNLLHQATMLRSDGLLLLHTQILTLSCSCLQARTPFGQTCNGLLQQREAVLHPFCVYGAVVIEPTSADQRLWWLFGGGSPGTSLQRLRTEKGVANFRARPQSPGEALTSGGRGAGISVLWRGGKPDVRLIFHAPQLRISIDG
mmetsp:Transcript_15755/g.42957  ORF Transcript_15755/g.42957 Transcript_15755/m.42957 type:complete len:228 (-) Transcript_15755:239-922(-)